MNADGYDASNETDTCEALAAELVRNWLMDTLLRPSHTSSHENDDNEADIYNDFVDEDAEEDDGEWWLFWINMSRGEGDLA